MSSRFPRTSAAHGTILCAAVLFSAQLLFAASPTRRPADRDVVEVVPTARQEPATWRYTFDRPADGWTAPGFDDSTWRSSQGGFGTGGTPGWKYFVLASTNVSLPLSEWTRVATNDFDSTGNFAFTSALEAVVQRRFYLLQIE